MNTIGKPFELKGGHVLAMILGFFALVIGVNATFIVLATDTFPGEDVRRSYLQGLHYNDTLAERRAQAALGWTASAAVTPTATGAELRLSLRDREGAPIEGAVVTGELRRPADDAADTTLAFNTNGLGDHVASLPGLAPGAWIMRARIEQGGRTFDVEHRFSWTSAS